MWQLDCEEGWAPKNWCFWTVVLEKTLESPLDCREIQPVHSKGDQSWYFFGRTDAKAETPVLWPPHVKSWLTGKDFWCWEDWGQEEKGTTEDEMVGWHHQLNGHGFGWTLGVGDGQGGLVCCDSWDHRVGHNWATELNWTELTLFLPFLYLRICFFVPLFLWLFGWLMNHCCFTQKLNGERSKDESPPSWITTIPILDTFLDRQKSHVLFRSISFFQ